MALLLKAGAPVGSLVAEDNSTPLHKACAGSKPGHLASVKLLLDAGADVHALNKWRETPLLTAANHGQAGAVEALLAAGADPCKCTDTGWSPLSIAAYKGHDDVVRLLLEDGAPTEEADPTLSALLQAATKGLPDTVELLLSHGADHTVTTKKGDTALSILVEQNLIDAAVEMVAEYNASIPRCSRDRKKVQRARLLINHRMKQLEREGKNASGSTDDDETDNDESSNSNTAQHQQNGAAEEDVDKASTEHRVKTRSDSNSSRSNGSNRALKMTAEEKAKAAEEALLLELEQEDMKAKKEEEELNSKRAKKKKKKERERQQKLKEERERREKEEKEARERERERQEKEAKLRKEQELKLKEQKDREAKEALEREKVLAAKRKERERKEREELKKREKETKPAKTPASASVLAMKHVKEKKNGVSSVAVETKIPEKDKMAVKSSSLVAPVTSNRRWETKTQPSASKPTVAVIGQTQQADQHPAPHPATISAWESTARSAFLLPQTKPFVNGETSSSLAQQLPTVHAPVHVEPTQRGASSQFMTRAVEHPTISLFRREKVAEMVQRCTNALGAASAPAIRRIIYRWIVRATHDSSALSDPLIPSWNDTAKLLTYFQRQFIAENRRGTLTALQGVSIEALKEAGSSAALLCQSIAKEVEQFRHRVEEHLPPDWSDAELGMKASELMSNEGGRLVSISWTDRAAVYVPALTYNTLRERYVGPPGRLLASIFAAKIWYETKQSIVADTTIDVHLPLDVQSSLASELAISAEFWSDPFLVYGSNVFWGNFEDVDVFFGGQKPFSKEGNAGDDVLSKHGGSVSVLPPLDNMIAAQYIQRMLNILEAADSNKAALSFAVFLHAECFPDLGSGISPGDLYLLDNRLGEAKTTFTRRVELLRGGQHIFQYGGADGVKKLCPSNSLFVLLQNDAGNARYGLGDLSMSRILKTMSPVVVSPLSEATIVPQLSFHNEFSAVDSTPISPQPSYLDGLGSMSPEPRRLGSSNFGSIGGNSLLQPFSPTSEPLQRGARRGRLFDLVDDGDEEQNLDVDVVSGMLNSLDVGLFQSGNACSDVDIEAISLMGIGGQPMQPINPGNPRMGRFG